MGENYKELSPGKERHADERFVDNRTPSQKEAGQLRGYEYEARTAVNEGDRKDALNHIQSEVTQINKQGYEFAKSVYQDLNKNEAPGNVPMVEFTDGKGMTPKSSKALNAQVARESQTADAQLSINLKEDLRKSYNLPANASEQELQAAQSKQLAIDIRKSYGLPPDASEKELQAAQDKKSGERLRELYGLPSTASDEELREAETKRKSSHRQF